MGDTIDEHEFKLNKLIPLVDQHTSQINAHQEKLNEHSTQLCTHENRLTTIENKHEAFVDWTKNEFEKCARKKEVAEAFKKCYKKMEEEDTKLDDKITDVRMQTEKCQKEINETKKDLEH